MKISRICDVKELEKLGFYSDDYVSTTETFEDPFFVVMSYDGEGFSEAKKNAAINGVIKNLKTQKEFQQEVEDLILIGCHDFSTGNCRSFQIYREDGEMIFNSVSDQNLKEGA